MTRKSGNLIPRHLRMTKADRERKVAAQYRRRLGGQVVGGRMKFHLGTREYWRLYHQRLEDQEGMCAICGRTEPGGRGRWHLDHNKKTGEIRGLLCCDCNLKMGFVEIHLSSIIKYLRKWR